MSEKKYVFPVQVCAHSLYNSPLKTVTEAADINVLSLWSFCTLFCLWLFWFKAEQRYVIRFLGLEVQ